MDVGIFVEWCSDPTPDRRQTHLTDEFRVCCSPLQEL